MSITADREQYVPEQQPRLPEVLHSELLQSEINLLQDEGFDITVVHTTDSVADANHQGITRVYTLLDKIGDDFAAQKADLEANGLNGKELHKASETLRAKLLYDQVGGQAWHEQAGCATALLTIQEAGKGYETMSAMVGNEIFEHVFDDGLSLSDKIVETRMNQKAGAIEGQVDMPTALSLYEEAQEHADKRLRKLDEFIQTPNTDAFSEIVKYCSDSLGIRARKELMKKVVTEHVELKLAEGIDIDEIPMVSLGCGTAIPVFELASELKQNGLNPQLILIDQDPVALAFAGTIAAKLGLQDNIKIVCTPLLDDKTFEPVKIEPLLDGKKALVIEDSGLREYLPPFLYVPLTKECWNSLDDDGIMVSGNMNINRPQADFLHGLMGWTPAVDMRPIKECITMHEEAGVPTENLKMRVTREGVYTIYAATKK